MARSLNAAWVAAITQATPDDIRTLMTLHVDNSTSYQFLSGPHDTIDAPETIRDSTPVARGIDLITRSASKQSYTITLARDPLIESLITTYGVMGAQMVISVGTKSLAEASFEDIGTFIVRSPKVSNTSIALPGDSAGDLLSRKMITGYWISKHPLEIIEDIASKAGVPDALIDSTSFDPTQYPTTISHLNTSRASLAMISTSRTINEPTDARELVDELAALIDGAVDTGDDGKLRFVEFDSSASSVADLTVDDFADDYSIGPIYENIVNRYTVSSAVSSYGLGSDRNAAGEITVQVNEDNSQGTHYPVISPGAANTDFIAAEAMDTAWVNAHGWLGDAIAASGTGGTFKVYGLETNGMTGARWPGYPSGSQPATAQLSSSRVAYLKVDDEIIECDAATVTPNDSFQVRAVEEPAGLDEPTIAAGVNAVREVTYTISGRNQYGSTLGAHAVLQDDGDITLVWDVTLQILMAAAKVDRLAHGAPLITIRLPLSYLNIETTDFVTLTLDRFISKTINGLTTAHKLEVLEKKVETFGPNIGINLTLAYATETSPPVRTPSYWYVDLPNAGIERTLTSGVTNEDVTENHVVSGLGFTVDSGLDATIAAGKLSSINSRQTLPTDADITFTASKDTYISWDMARGGFRITETTLGAGQPTVQGGEVPLWKVVTDGSGITDSTDLRVTKALDGGKLVAQTVDTTEIADDAIAPIHVNREQTFGRTLNLNSTFSLRTRV